MASAEDIAAALKSAIGTNDEELTVTQFLDTGFPPLNYALSAQWDGGFPVGRLIEVAGPPSAGKTAITTAVMAQAQRMGGIAGFSDHERSFSLTLAPRLGLDVTPGRFVYKKPRTFEESIGYCVASAKIVREKKLIAPEAPIAWAFDSLAAMVPYEVIFDDKGKERDPGQINMRLKLALAAAVSVHFPALAQWAEELNICVIVLNQLRMKPGVQYGDPTYTPGGNAKEFYYSQRMMLSATKIIQKPDPTPIGMEVTGKLIKNKVARPFLTATWRFMFNPDGTGRFDRERSLIEFLVKEKILEMKRAGYVDWDGKQIAKEHLARQLEGEGATGFEKLVGLLPKKYDPPVVAEVTDSEEAAA